MYRVIGSVRSRALRVLWLLEELDLPFEHLPGLPHADSVAALDPGGRTPVLLEDGVPILDSTAALHYLADKHGRFTHPAGTLARARQDSLTQFLLDEFDATLWMAARHSFVLPRELRRAAMKGTLKWEFERGQKALIARMADGPFLLGAEMTVPDIILTHCGIWAEVAGFEITQPPLVAYLDRMRARPAFQRAGALGAAR